MKVGVITFPGSNCDEDMRYVLREKLQHDVTPIWHKQTEVQNLDMLVIPGGFSYGDYLRSGAIARFSPIMQAVIKFAEQGGLVLGICNGFQILTEAGLLPGTLANNLSHKFICKNCYIKSTSEFMPNQDPLEIPIAHGEGRYYIDENGLAELKEHDQIIFRYCNSEGIVNQDANPNGSVDNIAGVRNKAGNVLGMMPHPERASDSELGNTDGIEIFKALNQLQLV